MHDRQVIVLRLKISMLLAEYAFWLLEKKTYDTFVSYVVCEMSILESSRDIRISP